MHSKHHRSIHHQVHEDSVSSGFLSPPPPYSSAGAGPSGHNSKPPGLTQHASSFAPSPYDLPSLSFPEDNPKGWKAQMKNLAPGKSPVKLLEPPPSSFTRPLPPTLSYEDFPNIELIGNGTMLDKGFPYLAPFCPTAPHPFITHDVTEHDWRQFLHDIRIAGSLSPTNRIVSGVLPLAFGFGIILGLFATFGVEDYMRRKKKGPVSQLIDHWNNLFFHPRFIHIALEQGPRDRHSRRGRPQLIEKNWRLVISYRRHGGGW